MESVLASFHLQTESFCELLKATGGIVAGSAALAAYLPNTFTPNDLDIWVYSDHFAQCAVEGLAPKEHPAVAVRQGYNYLFRYFFETHGYKEVTRPVQSDAEYTSNPVFAILRSIQRFQHTTSGHSIQVMHCKVPVEQVLETFDLSVAKTWMDSWGTLHTHDPVATQRKEMYSLRDSTTDRETMRITKYIHRGFTFLPNAADTVRLDTLAAVCTKELENPSN